MKLWAGRFQKETDTQVNDFNSSILFDQRMYKQDIQGSLAHATMLGRQGIITKEEADDIVNGLTAILQDIEDGKVEFSMENEDIHMNIEAMLTQRIGPDGKRLHTGRSRNDQVAVDFRLYVKSEIPKIIGMLLDLEKVLTEKAKANTETVMPGYTHMQRAQPTTFAHYMMAYANMIRRDIRIAWSGWTSARWVPARWQPPPIPSTGNSPPMPWDSRNPRRTPWIPYRIGISPSSSSPPAPS